VGLAHPDRAVEDDRFPGVQPAQRGQVADPRYRPTGGNFVIVDTACG
jgi:hypothetical protein